jgi:hypothetical protein
MDSHRMSLLALLLLITLWMAIEWHIWPCWLRHLHMLLVLLTFVKLVHWLPACTFYHVSSVCTQMVCDHYRFFHCIECSDCSSWCKVTDLVAVNGFVACLTARHRLLWRFAVILRVCCFHPTVWLGSLWLESALMRILLDLSRLAVSILSFSAHSMLLVQECTFLLS